MDRAARHLTWRTLSQGVAKLRSNRSQPSPAYLKRTEQSVIDSDGTVIISIDPVLTGGSKRTAEFAKNLQKPWLHIHSEIAQAGEVLRRFIEEHGIKVLNVAGPRASSQPGIAEFAMGVLRAAS